MPSAPRSPVKFTSSLTKGVGSRTPSRMTRTAPDCSVTKTRPSGATSTATGRLRPDATAESVKPAGGAAKRGRGSSGAISMGGIVGDGGGGGKCAGGGGCGGGGKGGAEGGGGR